MALLIVVAVAAALFLGLKAWVPPAEHAIAISPGETVILKKITFGKHHRFNEGLPWRRLLARLPFAWTARFKTQTLAFDTTNDTSVAWLMWTGLPAQVYVYVPQYVMTDQDGHRVYLAGLGSVTRVNNTVIEARPLTVPLAGKSMRLGLYRLGTNREPTCIGEFNIPKPSGRRVIQPLVPQPLPIRQTDGNTAFTLTDLLVEENVRTEYGFAAPLTPFLFPRHGRWPANDQLVPDKPPCQR